MAAVVTAVSGSRSPETVLEILHADAQHKASLRMYFCAAELCRNYQGAFADETKGERVRLAVEYERLGAAAERERKEHGTTFTAHPVSPLGGAEHVVAHWHCPSCQTRFPEELVVCGKCGFDLRTGKPYEAAVKKPKPALRKLTGYIPISQPRHFVHAKRRTDYTAVWLILGAVAGLFVLLMLLGVAKGSWTAPRVPAAPHTVPR